MALSALTNIRRRRNGSDRAGNCVDELAGVCGLIWYVFKDKVVSRRDEGEAYAMVLVDKDCIVGS